jgi:hypothetical protein
MVPMRFLCTWKETTQKDIFMHEKHMAVHLLEWAAWRRHHPSVARGGPT